MKITHQLGQAGFIAPCAARGGVAGAAAAADQPRRRGAPDGVRPVLAECFADADNHFAC